MGRELRGTWLQPQVNGSFPARGFSAGFKKLVSFGVLLCFQTLPLPNLLPGLMSSQRGVGAEAFEPPTLICCTRLQIAPTAALRGCSLSLQGLTKPFCYPRITVSGSHRQEQVTQQTLHIPTARPAAGRTKTKQRTGAPAPKPSAEKTHQRQRSAPKPWESETRAQPVPVCQGFTAARAVQEVRRGHGILQEPWRKPVGRQRGLSPRSGPCSQLPQGCEVLSCGRSVLAAMVALMRMLRHSLP